MNQSLVSKLVSCYLPYLLTAGLLYLDFEIQHFLIPSPGSSWTPSPVVFTGISTEKMTGLKLKIYFEGSPDVPLAVREVDASEWFYLTFLSYF